MFRIKNILVCTDFSSSSDHAMRSGKFLHDRVKDSSVHCLHVCELPVHWDWSMTQSLSDYFNENLELQLMKIATTRLSEQMAQENLSGQTHIRLGNPYQAINALIQEKKIDLLIMGHKGKGQTPLYLGSLATKILSSSAIPVLISKTSSSGTRVAGLVDPNKNMSEIISVTKEISKIYGCPSEIVSLFGDLAARYVGIGKLWYSTKLLSLTDEERAQVIKKIRQKIHEELGPDSKTDVKVEISVEKKYAYHLNSILAGDHTDLVVMKRHEAGVLEKILMGSETRRMLEVFEGNLLILP
jgi:nucleotide-binding universal stress UspA family protein